MIDDNGSDCGGMPGDVADLLRRGDGDLDDGYQRWEDDRVSAGQVTTDPDPGDDASLDWVPFPVHLIPAPISTYVSKSAQAIGCDSALVALPMLASLAGAVGNAARLRIKKGWYEPCVIWSAVVGESGSNKSTGVSAGTRFINEHHKRKADEFRDLLVKFQKDRETWKARNPGSKRSVEDPEPAEPHHDRILVSDATVEALARVLSKNHRGVLCVVDELAGLLRSFNAYKRGGGDAEKWLSMFRAEQVTIDRKIDLHPTIIPSASVSLTGGIQPGVMRELFSGVNTENGLLARFLISHPPDRPKRWTDSEVDSETAKEAARVFRRLLALPVTDDKRSRYRLSLQARQRFAKFVNDHNATAATHHGPVRAAYAKLEAYGGRLALLFHLIDLACGRVPGKRWEVNSCSVDAAVEVVEWFAHETRRVYRGMAGGQSADDAELVKLIRENGGRITARELAHKSRKYRSPGSANEALERIRKLGLGRWETVQTSGRPSDVFVLNVTR